MLMAGGANRKKTFIVLTTSKRVNLQLSFLQKRIYVYTENKV